MRAAVSGPVYPPEEGRVRPRTDRDLKIQRAPFSNSISVQPHAPGGVLNSHPHNQPPNITLNERLRNEINLCREKMSVSLIAPKLEPTKISPKISSPAHNSPQAALITSPTRAVATKVTTVCSPTKEAAPTGVSALPTGGANTEVKVEQNAAASQVTAKKRRAPAKRKRAVAKRWKRDSESDFEFDARLGPRRARNAVNLVKSVKEKAKR
ncbi:unnamed protein product [Dibothriocephalus latus]|uniref:Uncharacterized protein n=1 Tax=Dibothriocephalus latus TaxID=60516 RepID=A0A3P7QM73_DIBLA|nr:unnamed protein product [Dibothriocephalus latus]